MRIKVRLLEELIDKAQLNQVKPDKMLEADIEVLRGLYEKSLLDLNEFLGKREKTHWRTWDKRRKHNFSLANEVYGVSQALELVREEEALAKKDYKKWQAALDQLVVDSEGANQIHAEMMRYLD